MQTPDGSSNLSDGFSVNDYYDSRVTFISGQSVSGSETHSENISKDAPYNNSSTTQSVLQPPSSNAAESNPSKIVLPPHLDTISIETATPSSPSLQSVSKQKEEISVLSASENESDEVFVPEVCESQKEDSTAFITPKQKKLSVQQDSKKFKQPVIIYDEDEENMMEKDIASLKIPSHFERRMPFKICNENEVAFSPDIVSLDVQKHFNIQKIPQLPQKSAVTRIVKIYDDASSLATSTPLVGGELDLGDFLLGGGTSAPPELVNSLKTVISELQYAKKKLQTVQKSYFDQQVKNMEAGWARLDEANQDFQALKNDEFSKIAEIRSKLSEEIKKKSAKEDAKRIKVLETEIQKLKDEDIKKNRQLSEFRVKFTNAEAAAKAHKEESENRLKQIVEMQETIANFYNIHKPKDEDVKRNRQLSEFRAKFSNAEATAKAHKEEADKRLQQIVEMQTIIAKAQTENSNLRVKLNLAKKRENSVSETAAVEGGLKRSATNPSFSNGRTNASLLNRNASLSNVRSARVDSVSSASDSAAGLLKQKTPNDKRSVRWSSPLTSSRSSTISTNNQTTFTLPGPSKRNCIAGMMNTKYEMTSRGNEYTFTNGPYTVICTELKCHCRLFEWNNGDFTWTFKLMRQKVEVYYFASAQCFEIWTPKRNRFLFFSNKQFEIHWRNGDKTLITSAGKRIEMYLPPDSAEPSVSQGEPIIQFEMYEDIGCVKWSTVDQPQEFFPDDKREGKRGEDVYSSSQDSFSNSVNCSEFKLRRLTTDGYTKLVFPNISLQLNLCLSDSVFAAKHVLHQENNEKEKRDCFSAGSCKHITHN